MLEDLMRSNLLIFWEGFRLLRTKKEKEKEKEKEENMQIY
jgi:hypothetical protein